MPVGVSVGVDLLSLVYERSWSSSGFGDNTKPKSMTKSRSYMVKLNAKIHVVSMNANS
jgi:hypothetical protein